MTLPCFSGIFLPKFSDNADGFDYGGAGQLLTLQSFAAGQPLQGAAGVESDFGAVSALAEFL